MSPKKLYQFEANITAAAVGALKAAGVTPVHSAHDTTADLPKERVDIEASSFSRASAHIDFAKNGRTFYNHFQGQLRFIVTTKRDATGPAAHAAYLGEIRALCDMARQALVVEGYRFIRIQESSGSITYINEGERDRSELLFDLELSIPGAFMDYAAA